MDERPLRDQLFLTVEDVAQRLGIAAQTVQDMIRRRVLGAIRVSQDYRVPAAAVNAYLRRQAEGASAQMQLPAIDTLSVSEMCERIAGLEERYGIGTTQFLILYNQDQDDPQWTAAHHRWAVMAQAVLEEERAVVRADHDEQVKSRAF